MLTTGEKYVWKEIPGSSHEILRRRILALPPGLRLLDAGAAGGHLGRAVRGHCAFLAGVEPHPPDSDRAREGYDDWRETDALHAGGWDAPFDAVLCADVIEHVTDPRALLALIRGWLKPGGVLLASLPNIANISIRLALLFGQFIQVLGNLHLLPKIFTGVFQNLLTFVAHSLKTAVYRVDAGSEPPLPASGITTIDTGPDPPAVCGIG